jgi:hypothetical protein
MVNPQEGMVRSIHRSFPSFTCLAAMLVQQPIHRVIGAQNRSRSSVDWSLAKSVTWNARQPHGVLTCGRLNRSAILNVSDAFAMPVGTVHKDVLRLG